MPCCVECGCVAKHAYRTTASTKIEGKETIRMTRCSHCGDLVDKYAEYDFVIIILDMILHKSQVYRHLIFNRMETYDVGIDKSLLKLTMAILFCDAYVKFAYLRALAPGSDDVLQHDVATAAPRMLIASPLEFWDWDMLYCFGVSIFQYMLYLAGTLLGAGVRFKAQVKPNYLVMCVLASSFGKLFYILMMVWDYPPAFSLTIETLVLSSNVVSLRVYLDCDLWSSGFVVAAAWMTRRSLSWAAMFLLRPLLGTLPFL
jgi:hypothetical protein